MSMRTMTTASEPAAPVRMQAQKAAKSAVAAASKTQAKVPTKPSVAAQPAKAATRKKPLKRLTPGPVRRKPEVGPEQRPRYVEVAAHFIAERHGFTPGREHEDWVVAEVEIDRMIGEGLLRTK